MFTIYQFLTVPRDPFAVIFGSILAAGTPRTILPRERAYPPFFGAQHHHRRRTALPEALRDTPTGETLQAIVDLDLEDLVAIRPPRGYGRD